MRERADREIIFQIFFITIFVLQNAFRLLPPTRDGILGQELAEFGGESLLDSCRQFLTSSIAVQSLPGVFSVFHLKSCVPHFVDQVRESLLRDLRFWNVDT